MSHLLISIAFGVINTFTATPDLVVLTGQHRSVSASATIVPLEGESDSGTVSEEAPDLGTWSKSVIFEAFGDGTKTTARAHHGSAFQPNFGPNTSRIVTNGFAVAEWFLPSAIAAASATAHSTFSFEITLTMDASYEANGNMRETVGAGSIFILKKDGVEILHLDPEVGDLRFFSETGFLAAGDYVIEASSVASANTATGADGFLENRSATYEWEIKFTAVQVPVEESTWGGTKALFRK